MAPTNFDRQEVQLFIEKTIGCAGPENLKENREAFLNFKVTTSNIATLEKLVEHDATCLFEKGIQSCLQGVEDLLKGYEAWAIVKLYYASYYLLRCKLAMSDISIIRNQQIYTLNIKRDSKPKKFRLNSDHKATIALFKREFEGVDIFSTQSIDDNYPFDWLASMREWVNYRARNFPEPFNKTYFYQTSILSIEEQISIYLGDTTPHYCFDSDYACLALPIKHAQLTAKQFYGEGRTLTPPFKKFFKKRLAPKNIPTNLSFLCP